MKTIQASDIVEAVAAMCITANHELPADVQAAFEACHAAEEAPAAKEIFRQLLENSELSRTTNLPLCQDTGLGVFFVEVGEGVKVEGGSLRAAINDGMIKGYKDGYLRKSSCDPFSRKIPATTPRRLSTSTSCPATN